VTNLCSPGGKKERRSSQWRKHNCAKENSSHLVHHRGYQVLFIYHSSPQIAPTFLPLSTLSLRSSAHPLIQNLIMSLPSRTNQEDPSMQFALELDGNPALSSSPTTTSFPKSKIKILLLEGVSENAVQKLKAENFSVRPPPLSPTLSALVFTSLHLRSHPLNHPVIGFNKFQSSIFLNRWRP